MARTEDMPKELREQIPDLLPYLHAEDRIVHVEHPMIKEPKPILALEALCRLTNAGSPEEIGERGPIMAAAATPENEALEELRLFETLFGRDSLIACRFLLPQFPKLAKTTLLRLAELQGTDTVAASEEEPGRIIHEYRAADDPVGLAITKNSGWRFPYYGSVDATPLFALLLSEYAETWGSDMWLEPYEGKKGENRALMDAFDAAIAWIERRLDEGDGFIEYHRAIPLGIENQVWKDSRDSYFHQDGSMANHDAGIASVEVQGYAYEALLRAASLADRSFAMKGQATRYQTARAGELREKASKLRAKVFEELWMEDARGGYFAIGADRDESGKRRKLAIRASNMGHLLHGPLLDGDDPETVSKRESVIKTLFSDEFLNASGLRTISKREIRFMPSGYHNGSVWLWDTYYVSLGMRQHGFASLADELEKRIHAAVEVSKRFPEFARGTSGEAPEIASRVVDIWSARDELVNRVEQPPQEIQAWTVAAILASDFAASQRQKSGETRPASDFERNLLESVTESPAAA